MLGHLSGLKAGRLVVRVTPRTTLSLTGGGYWLELLVLLEPLQTGLDGRGRLLFGLEDRTCEQRSGDDRLSVRKD